MAFAEVDGRRLGYTDTGGNAPAVVFSHGLLMDRTMFQPQVDALADRFRCISWDQRGHGDTGPAAEPFTFWDSAEDMVALCAELGVDRAICVGMSQGGFIGLRAALRRPEFVVALVLLDTQAGAEDPDQAAVYRTMAETWTENGLSDELGEMIAAIILGSGWEGSPAWIARWKNRSREHLSVPLDTLIEREDLHDRLDEITCPSIVIHGEADAAISVALAERLAAGLPGCERLVLIPEAGHSANLSHPGLVNAPLRDFVSRHAR